MDSLTTLMQSEIGPWTLTQIGLAFLFLLGAMIIRMIAVTVIGRRLQALADRTDTKADDVAIRAVVGPVGSLIMVFGVYLAFRLLAADLEYAAEWSDRIFKVVTTLIVAWGLFRLIDAAAIIGTEMAARTDNGVDNHLIPLLRKAAKVLLGLLAFVLVAQNLGYSISGLLAGLGLGGFAFALAAKDTLANLFGGVTILMDRPFRVGDWITFDGTDGVVEEIGLRSTRVRTFAKTLTSVPNQALANATVENHSLMPKRRIKMNVGVTYDATPDQMRALVARVKGMLEAKPEIDQDFMLVKFTNFGASSLDLFVYCFTVTTDWTEHLQMRQDVNLAIMDIVADLGLSIAFPTQTVHLIRDESEA